MYKSLSRARGVANFAHTFNSSRRDDDRLEPACNLWLTFTIYIIFSFFLLNVVYSRSATSHRRNCVNHLTKCFVDSRPMSHEFAGILAVTEAANHWTRKCHYQSHITGRQLLHQLVEGRKKIPNHAISANIETVVFFRVRRERPCSLLCADEFDAKIPFLGAGLVQIYNKYFLFFFCCHTCASPSDNVDGGFQFSLFSCKFLFRFCMFFLGGFDTEKKVFFSLFCLVSFAYTHRWVEFHFNWKNHRRRVMMTHPYVIPIRCSSKLPM